MYEFTSLYLYKAVFMAELLVAELLMCMGMKRKPRFVLRGFLVAAGCVAFAFALPVIAYNAIYCSAMFLLMFAATFFAMRLCFDENAVSILFRCVVAYTMQHISYQIFELCMLAITALFSPTASTGGMYGDGNFSDYLPIIVYPIKQPSASLNMSMMNDFTRLFAYCSYFFIYILIYYAGYLFAKPRLKDSDKFRLKNSAVFVFVACFILFNVISSSVVTYYSDGHFDAVYVVLLALYNIICSFFTIFLMFEVVYRRQFEKEFAVADKLLKQSAEQYETAKQNIELINIKCHDLKHRIRLFADGVAIDRGAVAEIEDMISIYDSSIKTGNEALDIILTEKSLYCTRRGIKLYCIAEGSLLTFISDADLYSLFGNLMDNAIEAVELMGDGKRFINLSIKQVNGFPTISMANCYSCEPEFSEGLPKSTKPNDGLHGYGMKSVRLVCRKYNGELACRARNGLFETNIVFMK